MPYINDPYELMLEPQLISEIEFEEPRDYHEFFYDDLPEPGSKYTEWHRGIHSSICVFDEHGQHVYMSDDCPHFESEDEEGKRIKQGWTVQQNYG